MISLPVKLSNSPISELFPGARVVYGYEKGVGYIRVKENENLEVGKGYWILLDEDKDYILTGQPIFNYAYTVQEDGWAMVGGCSLAAKATSNNCSIVVIYGYVQDVGYQRVLDLKNIEPGKGYWILLDNVIEEAELLLNPS
jgi:hypothetical protein